MVEIIFYERQAVFICPMRVTFCIIFMVWASGAFEVGSAIFDKIAEIILGNPIAIIAYSC